MPSANKFLSNQPYSGTVERVTHVPISGTTFVALEIWLNYPRTVVQLTIEAKLDHNGAFELPDLINAKAGDDITYTFGAKNTDANPANRKNEILTFVRNDTKRSDFAALRD